MKPPTAEDWKRWEKIHFTPMTTKTYTTEDFARWGRQGGNLLKKTKSKDYFSQIASMRKNPGRKKKSPKEEIK